MEPLKSLSQSKLTAKDWRLHALTKRILVEIDALIDQGQTLEVKSSAELEQAMFTTRKDSSDQP